ncbi:MAG: AEC family transporter [Firmicutes bacterium]|nr:AEC family transporter [Bacillota bacterium]
MGTIINNIAAVFLIMGVGFAANKTGLLPEKANDYLSPLLIKITTPCLVLANIASREVEEGMWDDVIKSLLCYALYFVVFCFLAWVLCAKIMKIKGDEDCGVYMMLFASINNGFIGLPITLSIFGEEKLFYMIFFQMVLTMYIFGPGVLQVHYGDRDKGENKSVLKMILSPVITAGLIGVALLALNISLPEVILKCLDTIGSATTPLSMIVIGIQLGSSKFKGIIKNKRLMSESIIKMVLTPLITILLVNWLPVNNAIKLVAVFGASFPSAVAATPIAAMEGKNTQLAAEGVALTTLFSLVTIPLTAYLVSILYL